MRKETDARMGKPSRRVGNAGRREETIRWGWCYVAVPRAKVVAAIILGNRRVALIGHRAHVGAVQAVEELIT